MSEAFLPLTPAGLVAAVVTACARAPVVGVALRVLVDGADAAGPGALADAAATALRGSGRQAHRVRASDFLRPASLRLEHGHGDVASYRDGWVDHAALAREVLDPLGPGGSGQFLPRLRDPRTDRSVRVAPVEPLRGAVLLLDGPMLVGRPELTADLTVHLHLSRAALTRRTTDEDRWTIDALLAHENSVGTDAACDLLVRAEHGDRPALLDRTRRR